MSFFYKYAKQTSDYHCVGSSMMLVYLEVHGSFVNLFLTAALQSRSSYSNFRAVISCTSDLLLQPLKPPSRLGLSLKTVLMFLGK